MLLFIVHFLMFFISWLSLLLLKPNVVKRYMTATLSVCILHTLLSEYAVTHDLWGYPNKLFKSIFTDIPFVYGAFLAATLWVLALLYERPLWYFIVNAINAVALAYPINWVFEKIRYYELHNYKQWQIILVSFGLAAIAYLTQKWQDGAIKHEPGESIFRNFKGIELDSRKRAR